jgi:hypothetical protein
MVMPLRRRSPFSPSGRAARGALPGLPCHLSRVLVPWLWSGLLFAGVLACRAEDGCPAMLVQPQDRLALQLYGAGSFEGLRRVGRQGNGADEEARPW